MYQVVLIQMRGKKEGMVVNGYARTLPQLGSSFGVNFGDDGNSIINTSSVTFVNKLLGEAFFFETVNSSYLLRLVENVQ